MPEFRIPSAPQGDPPTQMDEAWDAFRSAEEDSSGEWKKINYLRCLCILALTDPVRRQEP